MELKVPLRNMAHDVDVFLYYMYTCVYPPGYELNTWVSMRKYGIEGNASFWHLG